MRQLIFYLLLLVIVVSCKKNNDSASKDSDLNIGTIDSTWVSYKFGDEGTINRATFINPFKVSLDTTRNSTKCLWSFSNTQVEPERKMCSMQFSKLGKDAFSITINWDKDAGNKTLDKGTYNLNTLIQSGTQITPLSPTSGSVAFSHSYGNIFSTFNTTIIDNSSPNSILVIENIEYSSGTSSIPTYASGKFYIAYKCPNSNFEVVEVSGRFNRIPIQ